MSTPLISRSDDLQRLASQGYEIEVQAGYLILRSVPYLTAGCEIKRGSVVSRLELAGDVTTTPTDHTVLFVGEQPYNGDGTPVALNASLAQQELGNGLNVSYQFSVKPRSGYRDYHHKMTNYVALIAGPAELADSSATPRTFAVTERMGEDSVFRYLDTATSRAGIGKFAEKLRTGPVAVVGLGGTGSYILDLIAKTPVTAIHLFDGDEFGQHNAFRSPGAPSIETLRGRPRKAEYFANLYAAMRDGIYPHGNVDESTIDELRHMSFVFVAVDDGPTRGLIAEKLDEFGVPFIDVGMSLRIEGESIGGQARVTVAADPNRVQAREGLPVADLRRDDVYGWNIQVADMNALNAALAVVHWKRLLGFYSNSRSTYSSVYVPNFNILTNRPDEEEHAAY